MIVDRSVIGSLGVESSDCRPPLSALPPSRAHWSRGVLRETQPAADRASRVNLDNMVGILTKPVMSVDSRL